jgi:hypothetical protein
MAWTNALIAMTILFAGKRTAPLALNNAGFQFLFVALYGACDEQEFKMEPTPPSWTLRALAYKSKETQFLKLFSDDVKLEFLFLVLHHEDDQNWHIATYLFALSTSPQSNSRMTIFIRQLLKIGAMHACSNHKATIKIYRYFLTYFRKLKFVRLFLKKKKSGGQHGAVTSRPRPTGMGRN